MGKSKVRRLRLCDGSPVQAKSWYAIAKGRGPGVYPAPWSDVEWRIRGVPAVHKGFQTREEAEAWFKLTTGSASGAPSAASDAPVAGPSKAVKPPTASSGSASSFRPTLSSSQPAPSPPLAGPSSAPRASVAAAPTVLVPDASEMLGKLSVQQRRVHDLILAGENVFFSGSAGTGKSFLLRCAIASLRQRHGTDAVAVTASTGIAAVNVGGTTLHSFAGIGLGTDPIATLIAKVRNNKAASARWRNTAVLVIDEVRYAAPPSANDADLDARRHAVRIARGDRA